MLLAHRLQREAVNDLYSTQICDAVLFVIVRPNSISIMHDAAPSKTRKDPSFPSTEATADSRQKGSGPRKG